jgi:hypothetical protein
MLDELQLLLADRKMGAATKLAFLHLWHLAGYRPGEILVTADWLAGRSGRSPRAALQWIDQLTEHGLLDVVERNERRGTFRLLIYHPAPGDREDTPDPQARLPFGPAGQEVQPDRAEVSAPEPPRPLNTKKESKRLSCQSTKDNQSASKDSMDSMDSMERDAAAATAAEPMGGAIASAAAPILALDKPAARAKLKAELLRAVPGLGEWSAGSAALLVVYREVPIQEIDKIVADIEAMREAKSLRNPGGFFNHAASKVAARYGVRWGRNERQKRRDEERANDG